MCASAKSWVVACCIGLMAVGLVGCTSSGDDGPPGPSASTGPGSAAVGSAQPSDGRTVSPVELAPAKLAELTSYNFEVALTGGAATGLGPSSGEVVRITGTYVSAPNRAVTLTSDGFPFAVDGSAVPTTYTVIGDQVWLGVGGVGVPVPQPRAAELAASLDAILPGAMLGSDITSSLYDEVRHETRNGVPATLWQATSTVRGVDATGKVTSGGSARWTAEVWIAEGGYPVAWTVTLASDDVPPPTAYSARVDLTHIDDPALKVQAPR